MGGVLVIMPRGCQKTNETVNDTATRQVPDKYPTSTRQVKSGIMNIHIVYSSTRLLVYSSTRLLIIYVLPKRYLHQRLRLSLAR